MNGRCSLAVVGSRSFKDYSRMCEELDKMRTNYDVHEIVSGGAVGADRLAERYARSKGIGTKILIPDWKGKGRAAGLLRNQDIVDRCDVLIAFWDGSSRGTKDSIQRAERCGKKVFVVRGE